MKAVRTREEALDELKRRRKAVGTKADTAEKKLHKMSSEHKNLPGQTDLLNRLRDEMRSLDGEIMNEEANLGDFKRESSREWMSLKFSGLEEMSGKGQVGVCCAHESITSHPCPFTDYWRRWSSGHSGIDSRSGSDLELSHNHRRYLYTARSQVSRAQCTRANYVSQSYCRRHNSGYLKCSITLRRMVKANRMSGPRRRRLGSSLTQEKGLLPHTCKLYLSRRAPRRTSDTSIHQEGLSTTSVSIYIATLGLVLWTRMFKVEDSLHSLSGHQEAVATFQLLRVNRKTPPSRCTSRRGRTPNRSPILLPLLCITLTSLRRLRRLTGRRLAHLPLDNHLAQNQPLLTKAMGPLHQDTQHLHRQLQRLVIPGARMQRDQGALRKTTTPVWRTTKKMTRATGSVGTSHSAGLPPIHPMVTLSKPRKKVSSAVSLPEL